MVAMDCHRFLENVGEAWTVFMGDAVEDAAVEATEASLDLTSDSGPAPAVANLGRQSIGDYQMNAMSY